MGRDWRDDGSKEFEKSREKHSRRELDTQKAREKHSRRELDTKTEGVEATSTKRQKTKVVVFLKETERNIKLWQSLGLIHVREGEGVCE